MVLVPMFAIATGGTHAQAGTARRLAFGGDTACLPGADESREWYARLADAADQAYFEFGDVLAGTGAVVPERGLLGHGGGVRLRLSADPRWGTAAFEFQDDGERGRTDGAFAAGWARSFGVWISASRAASRPTAMRTAAAPPDSAPTRSTSTSTGWDCGPLRVTALSLRARERSSTPWPRAPMRSIVWTK